MNVKKEYEYWLTNAKADADIVAELEIMDDAKIEDAFYRNLAFGTGGLRGVIGAGTNRMNIYTVAKASQGLADYLKKKFVKPSVAIGYDSRIKSDVFAKVAASVFVANDIKVSIWPTLMPVPMVSFATRYLHTSASVMVTASHNPSKYNGYKVYGADGCQITTEAAIEILAEIEKLDIFGDVKTSDFETGVLNGNIQYIPDEVYTAFVEQVNYAYFPVVFDGYKYTRNEIFEKLVEVGIGARKYFYPLTNSFECYRNYPTAGAEKTPIAQHIALRVLTLPLYADLSLKDVDRICDVILG